MFWQEDDDQLTEQHLHSPVQDVLFKIECKTLPIEHGNALSKAVLEYLPWMQDEPAAAIHQIHVAESANGWMRPEDPETQVLCVSRRTKLTLRIPEQRLDDVQQLTGKSLNIDGHSLKVGSSTSRPLSKLTTIFSRYVDTGGNEDETEFLKQMQQELMQKGIVVKKMMSGRLHRHPMDEGEIITRKLMLSDLEIKQSLLLQEQGLGDKKLLGMGIFLPHKGIDAVNKKQDN